MTRNQIFGWSLCLLLLFDAAPAGAVDYEVGPGQTLTSIGEVPWETLAPGDRVLIHWRSTPYREKWVLCRRGTQADPIVVSGVPGPEGLIGDVLKFFSFVSNVLETLVAVPQLRDSDSRGVCRFEQLGIAQTLTCGAMWQEH